MPERRSRLGGFTLIELMIVVAIIGILAAIAIPNFFRMHMRSKTSEAKTNLASIRTAEEGYFAEHSVYVAAPQNPPGAPVARKRPWQPSPGAFDQLGWAPEGEVYFSYGVAVAGGAFAAGATGDLDGALPTSDFAFVHPDAAGAAVAPPVGTGCVAAGVMTPSGVALDTVGPCTAIDGQSEF
jgi:prepilin-type N-terminal cleavage/methylation domain-containing protein